MSGPNSMNPWWPNAYNGAPVSSTFLSRWRSLQHTGNAAPWCQVQIRRGYRKHAINNIFPGSNSPLTVRGRNVKPFGQVIGFPIHNQFYPQWTPTTSYITLPGVSEIDLDQQLNFANTGGNGITTATITADNVSWVETAGSNGNFHVRERGWLWPWRGWVPTKRPGSGLPPNQWYNLLQNAQVTIWQGYGPDTAVKTFTGLIDTIGPGTVRPDKLTITARDFGGTLVDSYVFMWNKDKRAQDPVVFVPPNYPSITQIQHLKQHDWVIVNDATDIVRCALRWCGFQEWQIEDAGVQLKTAFPVDRSQTWMDVINDVAEQLGYTFFIAEPSSDDLSIGVPVFRKQRVLTPGKAAPLSLSSNMLTDFQPLHSNDSDRYIIRVRGENATRKQGGRVIMGGDCTIDGQVRYTFTYWPPWARMMSGVVKHLTYYNIGSNGVIGFTSNKECMVAAVLIAVEIAKVRDTGVVQIPANPAIGLDGMAFVYDNVSSGITSRMYVTSRKSTMTLGGDGSAGNAPNNSPGSDNAELLWSTQLTGCLVDNPEWEQLVKDYRAAVSGKLVSKPTTVQ